MNGRSVSTPRRIRYVGEQLNSGLARQSAWWQAKTSSSLSTMGARAQPQFVHDAGAIPIRVHWRTAPA